MTDNWNWRHEGVDLKHDHLLWYEDLGPVAFASGSGLEQSFADFLAKGPNVDNVPDWVIEGVTAELKKLGFER